MPYNCAHIGFVLLRITNQCLTPLVLRLHVMPQRNKLLRLHTMAKKKDASLGEIAQHSDQPLS